MVCIEPTHRKKSTLRIYKLLVYTHICNNCWLMLVNALNLIAQCGDGSSYARYEYMISVYFKMYKGIDGEDDIYLQYISANILDQNFWQHPQLRFLCKLVNKCLISYDMFH